MGTTNVDNVFENCADYTATQGYECVPYYQCHNGTIITDGGGLIDIRNGFASLTPEDSKCPGFLDVCCKDPDFIPPPPPPVIIKYVPQCGKFGRIFQAMIDKYTSCHGWGVGWEEPNAPIIDPAPPRTVTDNGDDSYNTNDEIVDSDDSYNTNDKLA